MKTIPPAPEEPAAATVEDPKVGLLRLATWVLLGLGVAAANGVLGTVLVVMAVLGMIVLHEAGHYFAAKATGMRVTEFFVGFGQRLWSVRKGETEYGVKALPLGGYCRIPGMTNLEEIEPEHEASTYRQASFPRKMLVVLAGVGLQMVLAWVLFWVLFAFVGHSSIDEPVIGQMAPLSGGRAPAAEAGLEPGDRVLSIDGRRIESWDQLRAIITDKPDEPVQMVVERRSERIETTLTPVLQEATDASGRTTEVGRIGVLPAVITTKEGPIGAVPRATGETVTTLRTVFSTLGKLFSAQGVRDYSDQVTGKVQSEPSTERVRFLSPVGLVRFAGVASDSGPETVLLLLANINIFVGILNLVPLLPFDGGHAAVAVYERIRSRKGRPYRVDAAKLLPVTYLVVLLLGVVALTSLYMDIVNPVRF